MNCISPHLRKYHNTQEGGTLKNKICAYHNLIPKKFKRDIQKVTMPIFFQYPKYATYA